MDETISMQVGWVESIPGGPEGLGHVHTNRLYYPDIPRKSLVENRASYCKPPYTHGENFLYVGHVNPSIEGKTENFLSRMEILDPEPAYELPNLHTPPRRGLPSSGDGVWSRMSRCIPL